MVTRNLAFIPRFLYAEKRSADQPKGKPVNPLSILSQFVHLWTLEAFGKVGQRRMKYVYVRPLYKGSRYAELVTGNYTDQAVWLYHETIVADLRSWIIL